MKRYKVVHSVYPDVVDPIFKNPVSKGFTVIEIFEEVNHWWGKKWKLFRYFSKRGVYIEFPTTVMSIEEVREHLTRNNITQLDQHYSSR